MTAEITEFLLDDIFINLDNISKIGTGDKLIHDNKYITVDKSYIKCVSRMLYGVSRNTNLDFIEKIFKDSFKHWTTLKKKERNDTASIMWIKLTGKMKESLKGLTKLRQTYSDDADFVKRIDEIMKNILKYVG